MTIAETETETVTVEELTTHWAVVLRAWEELDLPEPFDLRLGTSVFQL